MLPSNRENLSRCSPKLINVCKKLALALDCRQIKFSLWIYNIHIFSILGVAFAVSFLCYFQRHQLLVEKINNFCCIVLLFVWAQKIISQIFNILFQTGDINIFVLRGVCFIKYVQLKSSFSDERNVSGEIWDSIY